MINEEQCKIFLIWSIFHSVSCFTIQWEVIKCCFGILVNYHGSIQICFKICTSHFDQFRWSEKVYLLLLALYIPLWHRSIYNQLYTKNENKINFFTHSYLLLNFHCRRYLRCLVRRQAEEKPNRCWFIWLSLLYFPAWMFQKVLWRSYQGRRSLGYLFSFSYCQKGSQQFQKFLFW